MQSLKQACPVDENFEGWLAERYNISYILGMGGIVGINITDEGYSMLRLWYGQAI